MDVFAWFAAIGSETVVKATLLLAVALPFALLLERRRPASASLLSHALIAALLALPFVVAFGPEKSMPLLPSIDAAPNALFSATESPGIEMLEPAAPRVETAFSGETSTVAPAALPHSRAIDWMGALVLLYLAGAAWLLIRTAISWLEAMRLRERAISIDDRDWLNAADRWSSELGLNRTPQLRHSNEVVTPGTVGWLRPTILLPTRLLADASVRDAVLFHECCHVRRGDAAWQLLSRFVQAAYWFHPLAWMLRSLVGRLREKVCDAVCAARLGGPTYREALLAVAETIVVKRSMSMIAMAESHRLEDRLMQLETARPDASCRAGFIARWTLVGVSVLAVSFLGGAKLVAAPPSPLIAHASEQGQTTSAESVRVGGRVVLPDGKPASGANVVVRPEFWAPDNPPIHRTTADNDGRWSLSIPKKEIPDYRSHEIFNVWGWLPGYGLQGFRSHGQPDLANMEIRLVEDRPVKGRFVDETGKPIPRLKVEVVEMVAVVGESLDPWLAGMRGVKGTTLTTYSRDNQPFFGSRFVAFGVPTATTTDADGRFELRGFGAERVVVLAALGPTHMRTQLAVLNRAAPAGVKPPETQYVDTASAWNDFQAVVRSGSSVLGVVRDRETGAPISGVAIHTPNTLDKQTSSTMTSRRFVTTDAEGRFEVLGLPPDLVWRRLLLEPTGEAPYLPAEIMLPTGASGSINVEAQLDRGVVVQGRITDDVKQYPISDADVSYAAFTNNPHRHKAQGYESFRPWTSYNGKYRLVVPPGPGVLTFVMKTHPNRWEWDAATVSTLLGRDATKPIPNTTPETLPLLPVVPGKVGANTHNKVTPLDLTPGSPPQTIDVRFVTQARFRQPPSETKDIKGIVVGADGKPIAGVELQGADFAQTDGTEFVVRKLEKSTPRKILGVHRGKKLVGVMEINADTVEPVTLALQPWASIKGQLIGNDGKPLPWVSVVCYGKGASEKSVPDKEGGFHIEGLPPNVPLELKAAANRPVWLGRIAEDVRLRPGETRDLGPVRVRGWSEP